MTDGVAAGKSPGESDNRYRIISELTSDFDYAFRVKPNCELVSDWVTGALTRIAGFTAAELAARGGWESMIFPEDTSIPMEQLKCLLARKADIVEYRIVLNNIGMGIFRNTPGPKGSFIEANPAIVKMFGYENRDVFIEFRICSTNIWPAVFQSR